MIYRKNTMNNACLLIDTSFLLPALGIDVEKEVYDAITRFGEYEIYYLEISLIEAMWSVTKRVNIEDREIINRGLEAIRDTYNKMDLPIDALIKAWEIYKKAHKDYIDALLYSASIISDIPLLTIDKTLKKNLEANGYPTDNILFPRDIAKKL